MERYKTLKFILCFTPKINELTGEMEICSDKWKGKFFMIDDESDALCPICGEDLGGMDSMWRQIHVNGCVTKSGNKKNKQCREQLCPICGEILGNMSVSLANRHINKCMDKEAQKNSISRKTERCPVCGMSIKNLNPRDRIMHEQICQKADGVRNVEIIRFPKIVESLPTPQEWEIIDSSISYDKSDIFPNPLEMPQLGTVIRTGDLQKTDQFSYSSLSVEYMM